MTILRTAVALALIALMLALAFGSLAAIVVAGTGAAGLLSLVSKNEALLLSIVLAAGVAYIAALVTLIRFFLTLVTPRLVLPHNITFNRIAELERLGFSRESVEIIRTTLVHQGTPDFDLIAVTGSGTVGAIVSWGMRVLVLNPRFVRMFSPDELTAVLLHECGHVRTGIPFGYLVARQVNAACHLMVSEVAAASEVSVFHKVIDVGTWVIPPQAGRDLLRVILKLAALPLLGITVGMGAVVVAVFRKEFHAAEIAADEYVASVGHADALARALLRMAAFKYVIEGLGRGEAALPPETADWPTLVRVFEEYERANGAVEDEAAFEDLLPQSMDRTSTTHPSTLARLSRLGAVFLARSADSTRELLPAMEEHVLSWLRVSATDLSDRANALALGIVEPCDPATVQYAAGALGILSVEDSSSGSLPAPPLHAPIF